MVQKRNNKVKEAKIEEVTLQGTTNNNEEGFASDRILPFINYIPLEKGIQAQKLPKMRHGQSLFDHSDGRLRTYYATPFNPSTLEGRSKASEVVGSNQYFSGDQVWEEDPVGTYTLYTANKDNVTNAIFPFINPADWDPTNIITGMFPNQLEYGHQEHTGVLNIAPATPTLITWGTPRSVKYLGSVGVNTEYMTQTHGDFIITYKIQRPADNSGTYRQAQLEIDGNGVSFANAIPLAGVDTTTEGTYHVRLNPGSVIRVFGEHDGAGNLNPVDNLTYLHVSRVS